MNIFWSILSSLYFLMISYLGFLMGVFLGGGLVQNNAPSYVIVISNIFTFGIPIISIGCLIFYWVNIKLGWGISLWLIHLTPMIMIFLLLLFGFIYLK